MYIYAFQCITSLKHECRVLRLSRSITKWVLLGVRNITKLDLHICFFYLHDTNEIGYVECMNSFHDFLDYLRPMRDRIYSYAQNLFIYLFYVLVYFSTGKFGCRNVYWRMEKKERRKEKNVSIRRSQLYYNILV